MILLEISGFLAVCCGFVCCCPLSQSLPRKKELFSLSDGDAPLNSFSKRCFALFRMTCLLGFLEGLLLCPKRHLKTATGYSSVFRIVSQTFNILFSIYNFSNFQNVSNPHRFTILLNPNLLVR